MSGKTTDNNVAGDDGSGKETNKDWSVSSDKAFEPTPEAKAEGKEETEENPQGFAFAMIMISVLSSLFLVALDRTIVATAVPVITDHFHALGDVTWYAGGYLISSCATQLLWGRIYKFYSTKVIALLSILVFEVGSALCGAAPTSIAFIIGRAIAGLASASLYSGTTVIITQMIPLTKRPIYMALLGMVFGVSSVVGPLLGGAFTTNVSWRWCFYINLPIGGVSLAIMAYFMRVKNTEQRPSLRQQMIQLDPLGTLVFLPGVVCFLIALQWGGVQYAWSNGRIIALFVVAGVLILTFIGLQIWGQENATVPPRIIKQRSIAAGAVFSTCVGGVLVTLLYWIAIWFQAVKGTSAVRSGINTIPMVLSLTVAALGSGAVVRRTGYYVPPMYLGVICMSAGAGLMTTFTPETNNGKWIGYQILFGAGIGVSMQQPSLAVQNSLDRTDISTGVSLMFFGQSLGGAIFNSIAQALFNSYLTSHLRNVAGVEVNSITHIGATELTSIVPAESLGAVIQAYNGALNHVFILVTVISTFAIIPALLVEFKKLKPRPTPGQGPPEKNTGA
ncbi:hypothetical protein MMC22_004173 [Lobaria immixta]|nr:hypothetical protein [Lobaria immixta]